MSTPIKVVTGLLLSLLLVFFLYDSSELVPTSDVAINDIRAIASQYSPQDSQSSTFSSKEAEIETRLLALAKQAEERFTEILTITGPNSGKNIMDYDDNWCIAREDLTTKDQTYAENQLNEWRLNRGDISPRETGNPLLKGLTQESYQDPNAEYLTPYTEESVENLIELAKNDDKFALMTILSHPDVAFDIKTEAANRLLVLGNTRAALVHLASNHFTLAEEAKESAPRKSADHLKQALAFIEFGLMRHDFSSIGLVALNHRKQRAGIDVVNIEQLKKQDFDEIKARGESIYRNINRLRADTGLPTFDEIDDPVTVREQNAQTLFYYHHSYPEAMESSIFSEHWSHSYLQHTPCFKRKMALHRFMITELPVIKKEAIALSQQLPR